MGEIIRIFIAVQTTKEDLIKKICIHEIELIIKYRRKMRENKAEK